MYDFASDQQIPHIHKAIQYGRKAIDIREEFLNDLQGRDEDMTVLQEENARNLIYQKHRLGLSRMNLAFNLDSWNGKYAWDR